MRVWNMALKGAENFRRFSAVFRSSGGWCQCGPTDAAVSVRKTTRFCGSLRKTKNGNPQRNPFICNAFSVFAENAENLTEKSLKEEIKTSVQKNGFFWREATVLNFFRIFRSGPRGTFFSTPKIP